VLELEDPAAQVGRQVRVKPAAQQLSKGGARSSTSSSGGGSWFSRSK
jgi:hypothetical protein